MIIRDYDEVGKGISTTDFDNSDFTIPSNNDPVL